MLSFAQKVTVAAAHLSTSSYFSTGGDEINVACYEQDSFSNSSTNLNTSISDFVSGLHKSLRSETGKIPIVWQVSSVGG